MSPLISISLLVVIFLVSPASASTVTLVPKHNNVTDRDALVSFKSMISSDPRGSLASWNASIHFCQWLGVTCGGLRHPQRVISLNLSSLYLTGFVLPTITNITFLKTIDLSDNRFHGSIPQEMGRLWRLQYLNLSVNLLEGEYGMVNKISIEGDVYSYGILLLEMFTGKRPTDAMFKEGLNLRKYVDVALPNRILDIMDARLFLEEDEEASDNVCVLNGPRDMDCLSSIFKIGVKCSNELPADRIKMGEVVSELQKIKNVFTKVDRK